MSGPIPTSNPIYGGVARTRDRDTHHVGNLTQSGIRRLVPVTAVREAVSEFVRPRRRDEVFCRHSRDGQAVAWPWLCDAIWTWIVESILRCTYLSAVAHKKRYLFGGILFGRFHRSAGFQAVD